MRWKPLVDRKPPAVLVWALAAITSPVWAGLVTLIWLERKKQELIGPTDTWRNWFAWHPVHVWEDERTVWLEWIQRRRHWGETDYRSTPRS